MQLQHCNHSTRTRDQVGWYRLSGREQTYQSFPMESVCSGSRNTKSVVVLEASVSSSCQNPRFAELSGNLDLLLMVSSPRFLKLKKKNPNQIKNSKQPHQISRYFRIRYCNTYLKKKQTQKQNRNKKATVAVSTMSLKTGPGLLSVNRATNDTVPAGPQVFSLSIVLEACLSIPRSSQWFVLPVSCCRSPSVLFYSSLQSLGNFSPCP